MSPSTNEAATPPRGTKRASTGRSATAVGGCGRAEVRPTTSAKQQREVLVGKESPRRRRPSTAAAFAEISSAAATLAKAIGGGAAAGTTGRGGFRGSRTISVPTRGGDDAVVVVPKRPRPIWFAGSGAIQAEWSALPGGARVVRDLEGLEEQGRWVVASGACDKLLH